MEGFFTIFVYGLLIYLGIGFIFALAFAYKGAGKIDPVATEGPWGFRLLLIPGAIALWPVLLLKWTRS